MSRVHILLTLILTLCGFFYSRSWRMATSSSPTGSWWRSSPRPTTVAVTRTRPPSSSSRIITCSWSSTRTPSLPISYPKVSTSSVGHCHSWRRKYVACSTTSSSSARLLSSSPWMTLTSPRRSSSACSRGPRLSFHRTRARLSASWTWGTRSNLLDAWTWC